MWSLLRIDARSGSGLRRGYGRPSNPRWWRGTGSIASRTASAWRGGSSTNSVAKISFLVSLDSERGVKNLIKADLPMKILSSALAAFFWQPFRFAYGALCRRAKLAHPRSGPGRSLAVDAASTSRTRWSWRRPFRIVLNVLAPLWPNGTNGWIKMRPAPIQVLALTPHYWW